MEKQRQRRLFYEKHKKPESKHRRRRVTMIDSGCNLSVDVLHCINKELATSELVKGEHVVYVDDEPMNEKFVADCVENFVIESIETINEECESNSQRDGRLPDTAPKKHGYQTRSSRCFTLI